MQLKDYYKTLGVVPAATPQEIKKSFRQLALKFHPDKNSGDHLAEAQFKEIQEAYEVLSDPELRKEYNYKRWHLRSIGQTYTERPLTPAAVLEECDALKTYVESMSIFRINYDAVSRHIRQLLSSSTIGILQQYNDTNINRQIIHSILKAAHPLPLRYFTPITEILFQLGGADLSAQKLIATQIREKKIRQKWDSWKWVVMILLTALLCWLIYESGK